MWVSHEATKEAFPKQSLLAFPQSWYSRIFFFTMVTTATQSSPRSLEPPMIPSISAYDWIIILLSSTLQLSFHFIASAIVLAKSSKPVLLSAQRHLAERPSKGRNWNHSQPSSLAPWLSCISSQDLLFLIQAKLPQLGSRLGSISNLSYTLWPWCHLRPFKDSHHLQYEIQPGCTPVCGEPSGDKSGSEIVRLAGLSSLLLLPLLQYGGFCMRFCFLAKKLCKLPFLSILPDFPTTAFPSNPFINSLSSGISRQGESEYLELPQLPIPWATSGQGLSETLSLDPPERFPLGPTHLFYTVLRNQNRGNR